MKKGSPDLRFETILRTSFPQLVNRGIVSVYSKACTPTFSATNYNSAPNLPNQGECELFYPPNQYDNLITPMYTDNYYSYIHRTSHNGHTIESKRGLELLRGAVCATAALVPDGGVWVVHADLHLGNVLVKQDLAAKTAASQTFTSLADWGRAITFDSSSPESVFNGLKQYLADMRKVWAHFKSFDEMANEEGIRTGVYLQFSIRVLQALHTFYSKGQTRPLTVEDLEEVLPWLRGWMVYVLLKQYYLTFRLAVPGWLDSLFTVRTHRDLLSLMNRHLPTIHGEPYCSERFLENRPLRITPTPTPAINLGGGRRYTKKTRKAKRSSRKRV